MPVTIRQGLSLLLKGLLVAVFLGLLVFVALLAQSPNVETMVLSILGVLAMYLYFLLPAFIYLGIGLLVLTPFLLLFALPLGWLWRRHKRKQAERDDPYNW